MESKAKFTRTVTLNLNDEEATALLNILTLARVPMPYGNYTEYRLIDELEHALSLPGEEEVDRRGNQAAAIGQLLCNYNFLYHTPEQTESFIRALQGEGYEKA